MTNEDSTEDGPLCDFLQRVTTIWDHYRELGPGRVDPKLYDEIPELAGRLSSLFNSESAEILDAVETLRDLAHRCARRSEGLCFITGEAGMIPRQDLHDAMERALATLRGILTD